ncbi:MAG TPA: MBOAT family O-acyltransferase [bacterium]|nr:MBOAT family O-acyltransferase [bacterium]
MLFNSLVFVVFAFLFFLFWPFLKYTRRPAWIYLIVFSFFFYGWWDWRFLFLIILSGLIDFVAALLIVDRPRYRRLWLIVSMSGNLGTLAVFKYSRFVWENLHALVPLLPAAPPVNDFFLILPVGISFYTFQSMSYTIDVYRGEVTPTRSVLKFFAYLSLFPQLVAGPIVRARDFLHQLDAPRCTDEATRYRGLELILHGYFKKTVIADNLAPLVNAAFSATNPDPSSLYWWIVMVAFGFQIYCDFSGYSDIARGLAKWMGYDFMVNFNHPYTALSLREFWTRWHISLSSWFRDYVYIPLGGSKRRKGREAANLWATMLLSGLWHGASWNFVIWGGVHAGFLSLEKVFRYPALLVRTRPGRLIAFLIVSVQVLVAWVFFRAPTLPQALDILRIMFSFSGTLPATFGVSGLLLIGGMAAREFYIYLGGHPFFRRPAVQTAMLSLVVWAIIFLRGKGQEFIYFQF